MSRHAPSHQGWAPYHRGRGRGRGRGAAAPHRHRTLVLNNIASGSTPGTNPSINPASGFDGTTPASTNSTANGWIAKRDRHMQLINSSVYEKEAQARSKAMEETRKLKEQKKTEHEQAKVLRYAQGPGATAMVSTSAHSSAGREIIIDGFAFRVARGGSKLIRISSVYYLLNLSPHRIGLPSIDDPTTANNTPKRVTVAGVSFVRSKNGNLHRLGAVVSKKWVTF